MKTIKKLEKQLSEAVNKFNKNKELIELMSKGEIVNFGIPDVYECGSFFPCKFIETIDADNGIIKVYEQSIDKYHTLEVSSLTIRMDDGTYI